MLGPIGPIGPFLRTVGLRLRSGLPAVAATAAVWAQAVDIEGSAACTEALVLVLEFSIFKNFPNLFGNSEPSKTTTQKTLGTLGVEQIELSLKSATFLDW